MHQAVEEWLCLKCRGKFLALETELREKLWECPHCKEKCIQAKTSETVTITLTQYELLTALAWAHQFGDGLGWAKVMDGIVAEVRRQWPDAPPITLDERMADIKEKGKTPLIIMRGGVPMLVGVTEEMMGKLKARIEEKTAETERDKATLQ